MLVKPEPRFLIPCIIIFLSSVIILFQWGELISSRYSLLRYHDKSEPVIEELADINKYREVFSVSTPDKKYFFVDFIDQRSINPNIIPHPFLDGTWILVAQRHDPETFAQHPMTFAELTCNAVFQNGSLQCLSSPTTLPVETSPGSQQCKDDLVVLNMNQGPHDARVFYGPEAPYIVYGSNSEFTCFGQWAQNFGSLMDWGYATFPETGGFDDAIELQRPLPFGNVEKNWFLFWDFAGHMYAHYDISPKRSFALLQIDGSVGPDLAPQAEDARCMTKYMPKIGPGKQSIHQATNSLSVTLCERDDPICEPDEQNTFILTIFQHKRYRYFHSVYEPYAMLFQQQAPFKVHGISTKPFWIHGRWKPSEIKAETNVVGEESGHSERVGSWNQTEMFYITSISWRDRGQKYHGYIDDVVFLGFGIEDSQSAGIDVVVGDLLQDLGMCLN